MKKMFKVVALIAAIALMTGAFAGCGANQDDKNEKGQTVIRVGGWPDKEGVELTNMEARKATFEAANADIAIEPDFWKFDRKTFYAKAAGGQLPDVYQAGFTEVAEIVNSEYAADITAVTKERGIYDMLNPKVRDALSLDGKLYALPKVVDIMGLAFNTELMAKAGLMEVDGTPKQPKDWNEFVEFAVKIKEATGKAGIVYPTSKHGGWLFTMIAWSFGVDFMEKNADGKWIATFDSPEAAEAMQWIKDLKWKYDVVPAQALVTGDQWWEILGTGNAGMTISAASSLAPSVLKYGMKPNQIGMMALPAGPKKHVTLITGEIWCLNHAATKDQIDAGVRWLETSVNFNATDEFKDAKQKEIEKKQNENQMIGVKMMNFWNADSEAYKFEHELIDANINTNPNYVKLYNDFVANCPAEVQAEEPVCCQELYETLGACIQELFTNKDADPAELLKKANADFQTNYLDNVEY
ncbi:MAG: extracellular solute-binding protein [Clostridia bacterium]|nr:extracellular solute-binding protein [Clostridia bacterium]